MPTKKGVSGPTKAARQHRTGHCKAGAAKSVKNLGQRNQQDRAEAQEIECGRNEKRPTTVRGEKH